MIRSTTLFLLFVVAVAAAGCNKTDVSKADQTANANTASTANTVLSANANISNTVPANASSPAADLTGYSLASPSEAYRTAFEARKKCDIPVLKRVMSEEMTAAMVQRGENDPSGKKTLDEMLKDLCQMPQAPNGGIKDEKIVEDQGTVKYQDEHGQWRLMDFVRENGEWKLTMPRGKGELPALK